MNSNSVTRLDRVMTYEQFTQVVDAILAGKYSWACVLILRFAGYNPLHYIPYRTYNRLEKENSPSRKSKPKGSKLRSEEASLHCISRLENLEELEHLEPVTRSHPKIRGGTGSLFQGKWFFLADWN